MLLKAFLSNCAQNTMGCARTQVFVSLKATGRVALQEEAENIVEAIKAFLRSGVRGSEIAVMYPKHLYGDLVEMKLLQQRVAYRRYGNTEILDRCSPCVHE